MSSYEEEMDDELAQKMAKQTLSPLENFLLFKLENKSRELDAANGEIEKLWSELDQFLRVSSPTATTPLGLRRRRQSVGWHRSSRRRR